MQPGGGYALGGTFGVDAAFANGGTFTNRIVSSPTLFKFAKGGAMKTGLMGEAGEEAIMPLRRGPDGRLGVSAAGGGGGNQISVAVHVDASGGSQVQASGDTADNQGRQLGEAISRAVKDELLTQMRPGGLLAKK
jgi:lambda family phage tail tape measure protein